MRDVNDDDERRYRLGAVATLAVLIAVLIFVLARIFKGSPWTSAHDEVNDFIGQLPYVWICGGFLACGLLAGVVYLIRRGK